ncbi:sensor histidine kinase [Parasphingorhabdus pacifica]
MRTSFVSEAAARPTGTLIPPPRVRTVLVDLLFVLAICGLNVFDLALAEPEPGMSWWAPLLPSLPATCSLMLRRRYPRIVFTLLILVTVSLTVAGIAIGALNLAILLAVYTICVRSGLVEALGVSAVAMLFPVSEMVWLPWAPGVLTVFGAVPDLAMIVVLARVIRAGRRRRSQLEHTVSLLDEARDQLAADAATVERARIAREFHDIVSHNLSVVALRAGVARVLVDRDPEHARNTLHELEESSRGALEEMRNLLGALRDGPESDDVHWHPSPSLDGVDELVDSVRGGGVSWRLERRGAVRALGSGLEMTAYRIVQEAVTNVLKHAGAGRARVLLEYGPGSLKIEVTNHVHAEVGSRGPDPSQVLEVTSGRDGAGHGLVGLRERVALLGGTLTAHPIASGFHIAAVLPCPENSAPV